MRNRPFLALLVLAVVPSAAGAQVLAGPEFRVNTFTTGMQWFPSVASDARGNVVIVWQSERQNGLTGVFGQRYDAAGMPRGGEFQVNTYTTGGQTTEPSVAADAKGNFVAAWNGWGNGSFSVVLGRRYDSAGTPQVRSRPGPAVRRAGKPPGSRDRSHELRLLALCFRGRQRGLRRRVVRLPEHLCRAVDSSGARRGGAFRVGASFSSRQYNPSVASDASGNFVVVWEDDRQDGSNRGVFGQRFGGLQPAALSVDASASQSDGNGVLESGETVRVSPSWRNANGAALTFTGTASSFTGPASAGDPTYTIPDGAADYGTVVNGSTGSCGSDCYLLGISTPAARPVQHWDASLREDILPVALGHSQSWTLHVGDSFPDVPRTHPFYRFVETILHLGVTSGCTATTTVRAARSCGGRWRSSC